MAGAGAEVSTLCTTPLEAGCRRPYEAPGPTVSAHQRMDPVGIEIGPVSVTGCFTSSHYGHGPRPDPIHLTRYRTVHLAVLDLLGLPVAALL